MRARMACKKRTGFRSVRSGPGEYIDAARSPNTRRYSPCCAATTATPRLVTFARRSRSTTRDGIVRRSPVHRLQVVHAGCPYDALYIDRTPRPRRSATMRAPGRGRPRACVRHRVPGARDHRRRPRRPASPIATIWPASRCRSRRPSRVRARRCSTSAPTPPRSRPSSEPVPELSLGRAASRGSRSGEDGRRRPESAMASRTRA